jgi:hypothetical protein
MPRFVPYTALALYLSVLPATAADRYGGWLLEQPQSLVFTLSFKQSVPRNGKIATSELGFICDQRDKSANVGALLIPVDGTFRNRQRIIPVLIQKNSDQYDSSDLLQHWKNGTEYIFLDSNDDVDKLISLLKANEVDGVKSIHFIFPNDSDAGPQIANHIVVDLAGFSDGFKRLPKGMRPVGYVEASYTPKPNLFLSAFRFKYFNP